MDKKNISFDMINVFDRINTSMSSQLWTSVNDGLIGSPTKLEIF
jgi:hypothetical protein